MIDSVLVVTSALLGVLLLNVTVLLGARSYCLAWIGFLPIEVRYTIWLALSFLVALNGNQWVPGHVLFPILIIGAVSCSLVAYRRLSKDVLRELLLDGLSLFSVQLTVILFVFLAFQFHHYWLLESHNHDSLFYYYGTYWSNESKMFVGSEAVRARWGFDTWIGFDKSLYRGGTYTLEGWIQYFSPRITGNGLYLIAAYSASVSWFAIRLFAQQLISIRAAVICAFGALLLTVSTGSIGALVNSNLATVMGGASIALILALGLRSDIQTLPRYCLMGAWCAVGVQFYGESLFYSAILIFFALVLELIYVRNFKYSKFTRLMILVGLIVVVLGNIAVFQAISNLLFFSEIVGKSGDWFSWYLHNFPIWWVGSFVAGILMGQIVSVPMVILSCVIAVISASFLIKQKQTRGATLALVFTSLLAVTYISASFYQYGEHKILHLLGPSWTLLVIVAIARLFDVQTAISNRKIVIVGKFVSVAILLSLLVIVVNFSLKSITLLNSMRGVHTLDFGLNNLISYVRPGETVLLVDDGWKGVERFMKSHYVAFELKQHGAEVVMPELSGNQLRGGYQRKYINNTFKDVAHVQWLVKAKTALNKEIFDSTYGKPYFENADFLLYRVNNNTVFGSGNGWYDCESDHCWTSAPFEIEIYEPVQSADFEMSLNYSTFHPPKNGVITVRTAEGKVLAKIGADSEILKFKIPYGWSRLVVEPNWLISSPEDLGVSQDSRKLFLSIRRIKVNRID